MNDSLSGFIPIEDGCDAFAARIALAEQAKSSIDAQYFILEDDEIGKSFLTILLKAANRGVKVRLLLDDYWISRIEKKLFALNVHPNIEIRLINPFNRRQSRLQQLVSRFGSVTRRMHNKSFIIDNKHAVVGGRNIGAKYFEAHPRIAYGDLDVFVKGPVVMKLVDSFNQYWYCDLSKTISKVVKKRMTLAQINKHQQSLVNSTVDGLNSVYGRSLTQSALAKAIQSDAVQWMWGKARVIADSPKKLGRINHKKDKQFYKNIETHFAKVKNEVTIFTPYFVPGKQGVEKLISLARRGVDVRILTNSFSSNNHLIVHAHYAKYRDALIRAGIRLYEVKSVQNRLLKDKILFNNAKAQTLHAKTFVFDRESVFIGSFNLDQRSLTENTEIGIIFETSQMAAGIAQWFDNNINHVAYRLALENDVNDAPRLCWISETEQKKYFNEPKTVLYHRILMGFLKTLPIESQL